MTVKKLIFDTLADQYSNEIEELGSKNLVRTRLLEEALIDAQFHRIPIYCMIAKNILGYRVKEAYISSNNNYLKIVTELDEVYYLEISTRKYGVSENFNSLPPQESFTKYNLI